MGRKTAISRPPFNVRARAALTVPIHVITWACCAFIAEATQAQITFQDVSADAQLDFLHWDGVVPSDTSDVVVGLLYMVAGVAAGDFDRDGWVDLFVTRLNAPSLLLRNLQNGTFENVGAERGINLTAYATGCAWADVDNDGDLDLYVLTMKPSLRNYFYVNDGTGHFTEDAANRGLLLAGGVDDPRQFISASFGDYDLDGQLDLYVTKWAESIPDNRLFHNEGQGYFIDATISAQLLAGDSWQFTPRFSDIDGDGWVDLLVASDFGQTRLYLNQADGTFSDITASASVGTDENGMGATTGDLDNDGDLDWFVTSIFDPDEICEAINCGWKYSGNRLYRNDGLALFGDATDFSGVRDGGWGWGTSFLDYDNDGDLDLAMTNGVIFPWHPFEDVFNTDPVRLWRNDGPGAMVDAGAATGFVDTRSGKGMAVFDYDRDGDLDLFIANNADFPVLYRNDGGEANDYLRIRLIGRQTNRDGIGARVFVLPTPDGTEQMREVSASSNYMSHNEMTSHFGLGSSAGIIHRVRVEWPRSGFATTLSDVAVNQTITVVEPRFGDCDDSLPSHNWVCFEACADGPGAFTGAGCERFDADQDGDVDLCDFAQFQRTYVRP